MRVEGHIHDWSLRALVDAYCAKHDQSKAEVARDAVITPQQLSDLLSGRRAGTDPDVRGRLAGVLRVDPRAITCWCDDRPTNHGGDL